MEISLTLAQKIGTAYTRRTKVFFKSWLKAAPWSV